MCYCIIIILLVHCLLLNINACIYLYDIQFAGGLTCMTLYDILSIYYHKPIVDQLNNKNTMPSTNHNKNQTQTAILFLPQNGSVHTLTMAKQVNCKKHETGCYHWLLTESISHYQKRTRAARTAFLELPKRADVLEI